MYKLSRLICTFFGVGKSPIAPGTCASLLTLPIAWITYFYFDSLGILILATLIFTIGIFSTNIYLKNSTDLDPPEIVIDEVVGQLVALIAIPNSIILYFVSFLLFRYFDIKKPGLIKLIDRKVKNSFGVMLDDIIAGFISLIIILIVIWAIEFVY